MVEVEMQSNGWEHDLDIDLDMSSGTNQSNLEEQFVAPTFDNAEIKVSHLLKPMNSKHNNTNSVGGGNPKLSLSDSFKSTCPYKSPTKRIKNVRYGTSEQNSDKERTEEFALGHALIKLKETSARMKDRIQLDTAALTESESLLRKNLLNTAQQADQLGKRSGYSVGADISSHQPSNWLAKRFSSIISPLQIYTNIISYVWNCVASAALILLACSTLWIIFYIPKS